MKKTFIALQVDTGNTDDTITAYLKVGEVEGPYYNRTYPEEEFDTEEEALEWAMTHNEYARWIILPTYKKI